MISETYGFLKSQKTCDTLKFIYSVLFYPFHGKKVIYVKKNFKNPPPVSWLLDIVWNHMISAVFLQG